MFDNRTPREELDSAERLERLIGSARIAPATPSSPELLAHAERIVGDLHRVPDGAQLRSLRDRR